MRIKRLCLFFTNVVIFTLFGVAIFLLHAYGRPFLRGYYCNDSSIKKPLISQTIPISLLLVVTGSLAFISFVFVESIKTVQTNRLCEKVISQCKKVSCNVIFLTAMFIYGIEITVFVTNLGKYTVGRLRPQFIAVCQPDWLRINCTDANDTKKPIDGDEVCKTMDGKMLRDARLSFPSGHASFAAFSAFFLISYIENEITCHSKWAIIPKLFVQVIFGYAAFYCGLTRVSDFKHHPTDVLAGFVIGITIGALIQYSVMKCKKGNHELGDIV